MRKALIVGINYYTQIRGLYGCVNDARAVKNALERHGEAPSTSPQSRHRRERQRRCQPQWLKDLVRDLFAEDNEVALLYFAGHGHVEQTGGYLCSSDCSRGDDGLSLGEVMTMANASPAPNKIIFLDSCHSEVAGTPAGQKTAEVAEGVTILTASTERGSTTEKDGSGVFTTLLVNALNGAAARPRRRHHAGRRVHAHRSVARPVGAAAGLQDECKRVRVAQEGDGSDPVGMAASAHRVFPEAGDEVSARSEF